MRYHLTGVDEGKREMYMIADDESCNITISAADEAWSGKASDIEVINAPDGATVFYLDGEGNQVAVIRKMENLPEESRNALTKALDEYYMIPKILRFIKIKMML